MVPQILLCSTDSVSLTGGLLGVSANTNVAFYMKRCFITPSGYYLAGFCKTQTFSLRPL